MKHQFFALSLGIGAMILATDHAFAEPASCAPRDRVLDRLATTYGETRRSIGLSGEEGVVEVFASDDTGTWTITLTLPSGQTCLVASGLAFESLAEALPPPGRGV